MEDTQYAVDKEEFGVIMISDYFYTVSAKALLLWKRKKTTLLIKRFTNQTYSLSDSLCCRGIQDEDDYSQLDYSELDNSERDDSELE